MSVFFHNPVTGMSTWQHPCDQVFKELVSACLAHRVTIAVTLAVRAAPPPESLVGAVDVVAHKLSGHETTTRVACPESVVFLRVRSDLEGELCQSLPANTVVRFFLTDGTQLGRSHSARTVAEVFNLPRSDAPVIAEVCPQLPIVQKLSRCGVRRSPRSCPAEPAQSNKLAHGTCFSL